MNAQRKARVEHALRDTLTEMIAAEVKDPRVRGATLLTLTRIEVNVDMSVANVYVSVVGGDAAADAAVAGLVEAAGLLRGPVDGACTCGGRRSCASCATSRSTSARSSRRSSRTTRMRARASRGRVDPCLASHRLLARRLGPIVSPDAAPRMSRSTEDARDVAGAAAADRARRRVTVDDTLQRACEQLRSARPSC